MRYLIFFLLFGFCVSVFYSCGDGGDTGGINIDIPEFSVDILDGSGIDTSSGETSSVGFPVNQKFLAMLSPVPDAFAQQKEISCEDELAFMNDHEFGIDPTAIELVRYFYAKARFYDCNTREQAQNGPVTTYTQTDQSSGMEVTVMEVKYVDEIPDDLTMFVAWTDATNLKGKLVNKYLQVDENRTKTRVDLLIADDTSKEVDFSFNIEDSSNSMSIWSRAIFQEVGETIDLENTQEFSIVEHLISGRYYRTGTVYVVRASVKKNVGTSVFMRKCSATSPNEACAGSDTEHFYDSNGDALDKAAAQAAGLSTDVASTGIDILSNFFSGSVDDYFAPEFDIND